MDDASRCKLLEKIEYERNEMHMIYNSEPDNLHKLLEASRRLDRLIVLYQQLQQKEYKPVDEIRENPVETGTERSPGQPLQSELNRYDPIFP